MHNAPPVDHPVGRSFWWAVLLLLPAWPLVWLSLDRLMGLDDASAPVALVAGLVVATALWLAAAVRSFRRQPAGRLRWAPQADGVPDGGWYWREAGHDRPCHPRVVIDLQSACLLQLTLERDRRWMWVEAHRDPVAWPDLRRALMASRGNPDAPGRSGIFPRA